MIFAEKNILFAEKIFCRKIWPKIDWILIHRLPRVTGWPARFNPKNLNALMASSWKQEPCDRPKAKYVASRLKLFLDRETTSTIM